MPVLRCLSLWGSIIYWGLADYRARERAMSLLFQIAGRSGRAKEANVLVQTGDAEFFKSYLNDYEDFIKDELDFLEIAHYPPFASLARILIAHKDESKAGKITLDTVTKLKEFEDIEIVGSGKAPVERSPINIDLIFCCVLKIVCHY